MNAGVFTSENGKTNERIVFTVVRSAEPLTVSFRMSSMSPPFIVLYTFSVDVILTGEELMQFITVNNGIVTEGSLYVLSIAAMLWSPCGSVGVSKAHDV